MSSNGTSLTIDEAEDLLRQNWDITLYDKTRLEPCVAGILAKHPGPLDLYSLKELSVDDARSLAEHQGRLHLRDLSSICDEALSALVKHEGLLIIPAPKELSEAQAEALGRHRGPLVLQGVEHLTTSVASCLAHHKGPLYLNDLRTLSLSSAEALLRHRGPLFFFEVSQVSDEVAEALAKHQGRVGIFPLTEMSERARGILKAHREGVCKTLGLPVSGEFGALSGTFQPAPVDEKKGWSYIYYSRSTPSEAVPVRICFQSGQNCGAEKRSDELPDWFALLLPKLGECIEQCSKIPPGDRDPLYILDVVVVLDLDSKNLSFHGIVINLLDENGEYWEVCVHGPSFPAEFHIDCWGGGHYQSADYLADLPLNHSIFDSTLEGLKWWQKNTIERARADSAVA
jgi:hypothetical protein